jgi:hypothetical protein
MNSKGQVQDGVAIFIKIFQILIILGVFYFVFDAFFTAFSTSAVFQAIMVKALIGVGMADYVMPILFGVLIIFNVFSGARVRTKNVYLVLSLIMLIISLPIVAAINNMINFAVVNITNLHFDKFPITVWILDNMFVMYIIIAFAWMIGFYVKKDDPVISVQQGGYFE